MKHFIYTYCLPLAGAWTLLIFILCATPGKYIPSADWLELLSFDKFVHAAIFFIFTGLWFLVAFKSRNTKIVYVICFFSGIAYGVSLEWMQANWFSNRSADWKDMVANSFGCTLALLFLRRIKSGFSNHQTS